MRYQTDLRTQNNNLQNSGETSMADIPGTPLGDTLVGTTGNDNIYGYEGNDVIYPISGQDYIDGGAGVDRLIVDYSAFSTATNSFSFDNVELVYFSGSQGADRFYSSISNDTLYGNGGNDTLDAGTFHDYVNGGTGNDVLYGGSGNDTLDGWYDNDTLYGGTDQDLLLGSFGNDYLVGGDGNDTLYGEPGKDTLYGGAGADKFGFYSRPSSYEGIDVIQDFKYSEGDKLEISISGVGASSPSQFSFNNSTGALYVNGAQLAALQPGSGFSPSADIVFVA
jgi:Ca2+-binding RTX toxin-like protein